MQREVLVPGIPLPAKLGTCECMNVTAQTPSPPVPSSSSWPVHAAPSGVSPAVTDLFTVCPC